MGFKIKKTVNGEIVWESIKAKKYTASKITECTEGLPITITTNGEPLIDYRIYGNTEQTGTPTLENPITPIGGGERVDITGLSEPLCGIKTYTDNLNLSTGILTRRIKKLVLTGGDDENWSAVKISTNNVIFHIGLSDYPLSGVAPISTHYTGSTAYFWINVADKEVTVSIRGLTSVAIHHIGLSGVTDFKSYLQQQYAAGTPVTVWYVLEDSEVSTISIPSGLTGTVESYLIQNDTPTPENPIYPTANGVKQADGTYSIPYGYKLPILSNSTVTNIYLGEVQTTRRIKKLVLTGNEEGWSRNSVVSSGNSYTNRSIFPDYKTRSGEGYCTHYPLAVTVTAATGVFFGETVNFITDFSDGIDTSDKWKSYLAAQYAAGTPVTVWYVLSEPETGIVNEPLMKIGNYADTVSMEQAGVSIPTNKGGTVIDYDGALKPSQMYVKYNSWSGWSDIDNYKVINENWTQEMT